MDRSCIIGIRYFRRSYQALFSSPSFTSPYFSFDVLPLRKRILVGDSPKSLPFLVSRAPSRRTKRRVSRALVTGRLLPTMTSDSRQRWVPTTPFDPISDTPSRRYEILSDPPRPGSSMMHALQPCPRSSSSSSSSSSSFAQPCSIVARVSYGKRSRDRVV